MAPLAPAVAVVGPAGSGKTTLLHLLDRILQNHPSSPLVYVVKGNPDGTGRYLLDAPELRETFKSRVKGAWGSTTMATIASWIDSARSRLELVLVDVGGRHSSRNREIYDRCSHFLVVARDRETRPADSRRGDLESWWGACLESGLEPVARVWTFWNEGSSRLEAGRDGVLDLSLRIDPASWEAREPLSVVRELAEALLALRVRRPVPGYLDLRLDRQWVYEDLGDLGGRAAELTQRVREGRLLLGGRAPIWAYAAAMHRGLDLNPELVVEAFDPKVPAGIVPLPPRLEEHATPVPGIRAVWRRVAEGTLLDLVLTGKDRFLGLEAVADPGRLPVPDGSPDEGTVGVFGAAPIWVHLGYSRWLRLWAGDRPVGVWDAGGKSMVLVAGPGTPRVERWRSLTADARA